MDDEYAGICGITKEELLENMSDDIDMLADALGYSREMMIAKLKENYDGYHSLRNRQTFSIHTVCSTVSRKGIGGILVQFWYANLSYQYVEAVWRVANGDSPDRSSQLIL